MDADAPVFNELGTTRLFEVLVFEVFRNREPVLVEHIEKYCISRALRSAPLLPATLLFLEWLLLLLRQGDQLVPTPQLSALTKIANPENLGVRLAQSLISRLRDTHYFTAVFCDGTLTLEPQTRALYIATAKVPLKFLQLVVLLRNFGLLQEKAPGTGLLAVDPRLSDVLSDVALSSSYRTNSRQLSLENLKAIQAAQQLQGAEAEEYVVALERKRLSTHPRVSSIRSIASEDVAAGFDIVSFETALSLMYDRFIEVKSFKGRLCFFWSRNEYEVAKRLRDSYYLFIVDINRVDDQYYAPLVIRNPVETILDKWLIEPDSWLVTQKTI